MDIAAERQRKFAAPVLLLILGVVFLWWVWIWPRTWLHEYYREARLKAKLQSIRTPAGIQRGDIQVLHFQNPDSMIAMRFDFGTSGCIAGGAHYRTEFAHAGFGYNGEQIESEKYTWTFSSATSDYQASMVCQETFPGIENYLIIMRTKRA